MFLQTIIGYLPEIDKYLKTDCGLIFLEPDWCLTGNGNLYKLGAKLPWSGILRKIPHLDGCEDVHTILSEDTIEKYNETLVRVKSGDQFKGALPTYYVSPNIHSYNYNYGHYIIGYVPEINKHIITDVLIFLEHDWCLMGNGELHKLGTELPWDDILRKFPQLTEGPSQLPIDYNALHVEQYHEILERVKSGGPFDGTFETHCMLHIDHERYLIGYFRRIEEYRATDVITMIGPNWCLTKNNCLYKLGQELPLNRLK